MLVDPIKFTTSSFKPLSFVNHHLNWRVFFICCSIQNACNPNNLLRCSNSMTGLHQPNGSSLYSVCILFDIALHWRCLCGCVMCTSAGHFVYCWIPSSGTFDFNASCANTKLRIINVKIKRECMRYDSLLYLYFLCYTIYTSMNDRDRIARTVLQPELSINDDTAQAMIIHVN